MLFFICHFCLFLPYGVVQLIYFFRTIILILPNNGLKFLIFISKFRWVLFPMQTSLITFYTVLYSRHPVPNDGRRAADDGSQLAGKSHIKRSARQRDTGLYQVGRTERLANSAHQLGGGAALASTVIQLDKQALLADSAQQKKSGN